MFLSTYRYKPLMMLPSICFVYLYLKIENYEGFMNDWNDGSQQIFKTENAKSHYKGDVLQNVMIWSSITSKGSGLLYFVHGTTTI